MIQRMDVQQIPMVMRPQVDCSWCWYARGGGMPFPNEISSDCCPEHQAWLLKRLAEKRAARRNESQVQA